MKREKSKYHSGYSNSNEIWESELIGSVGEAIERELDNPEKGFSPEAREFWAKMTGTERNCFIESCLVSFYWVYIVREEKQSSLGRPSWKKSTFEEQSRIAAAFCFFLLKIEFECEYVQDPDLQDFHFSPWVN